ncbi:MAG: chromosomal replication initiator protein DnaA [Lachnospiraceae bacterium]|jgi:chromosomal replication initiator protein|uniref:chromosomal replication initiator protein DnaA n=1 Tax=Sharpea azabuensis TaxID=322505 RepID=UPI001569D9B2|nr:chromosomal replication initiator protein DnaA [Sharpea azabuensis]MDD6147898.1 chromosomal replication initiator protein DnaA [Lachnospiraceae bacterium]MDY5704011.1 chromosomal replication initiator protein DnaA [Lachnospiraceae bacterium]
MELVQQKWNEILEAVQKEYQIQDISYKTWIKPLKIDHIENNTIYILTQEDSDLGINFIRKKYEKPLLVTIAEITGQEYNLEFLVIGAATQTAQQEVKVNKSSNLNPKYTFDSFVVGNNNKFAHRAALAVAETPGKAYNPLYIYGGPGLGKTHLMHAIGNYILQENPEKKVIYVTSEEFLNEVIESIRSTNNTTAMTKFRNKYRKVDVLMIDDIQFIIGKEATQDEFFHTFNALHSAGKQIILTSDRPPKEMKTLEDRIRSRFEWGLMADIGYPDYETRMAIIINKVETEHINLNEDILRYIGENIKSNIREIEGAINKLAAYSRLENKEITMDIAREELQNIISPDKPREITPQLIIEVVAEHYDLSMEQMTSNARAKNIAKPRQIAMYLCKQMTSVPLEAIGNLLGGRDHSTIIHGANKISEEYEKDGDLRQQIETIKKKISPS